MAKEFELLTHSRMSSAKTCLKKHYFQYEIGLRRIKESEALSIGRMMHEGLDFMAGGRAWTAPKSPEWIQNGEDLDAWHVMIAKVVGLLIGYESYWHDDACEVVASEVKFEMPIANPRTTGRSINWRAAGKIDKIVKLPDGRLAIMEHKTTSESLDPDSDYWRRLELDQQISLYTLGAISQGYEIETILYDVIRKPSIRPKQVGKEKRIETAEEYKERLIADIAGRPEFYFARREIPRLKGDLEEFKSELWQNQKLLSSCQLRGYWYRNTSACLRPFRCEYLDVCKNEDISTNVPEGFHIEIKNGEIVVNPELED